MPWLPASGEFRRENIGDGRLRGLRVAWRTSSAGIGVLDLCETHRPLGLLNRLLTNHGDAATAGNYSVKVVDLFGADILLGLAASLTLGSNQDTLLYVSLGSAYRTIVAAGPAQLQIDTSPGSVDQTWGSLDLYYSPSMESFFA